MITKDEYLKAMEVIDKYYKQLDLQNVTQRDSGHRRNITEKEIRIAQKQLRMYDGTVQHLIDKIRENQTKSNVG